MHPAVSSACALLLALHGYRKQSLSLDGAVAAFVVGAITMSHPDALFPALLITFYLSGSRITKMNKEKKKKIEEGYHEAGNRNATQVLCNSLTGVLVSLAHRYVAARSAVGAQGCPDAHSSRVLTALVYAYVGHYATCAGDTFASEIGTAFASSRWSRLITTLEKVPAGTNGGVTTVGTLASALGGALIGLMWHVCSLLQPCFATSLLWSVGIGACIGLAGSLVDSVLGATVQQTRYSKQTLQIQKSHTHRKQLDTESVVVLGHDLLGNDAVNFLSSLMTALACGAAYYFLA
ncbi:hypothetical protein RI367_003879 [Sorochytrium milnesiophthora]